jgi:nucleoside-diphosphate-sugar epimerase
MRALVIGAGGFLGRALVAELARRGDTVTACSSTRSGGIDPQTGLLPPDFDVPRGTEAVYYLSQSPALKAEPPRVEHVLAVSVVSALHAARLACQAGVRQFFYASTGNVYALSFAPLRESDPVRRDNWYSLAKVQAEEALMMLRPSLGVTSTRLFGLYGAGQSGRLLPNLAAAIRAGRPVVIEPNPHDPADDGGLRLSLCHVRDAACVLASLASCEAPPFLNVASGETLSIRELACAIARAIGEPVSFEAAPQPRAFDLIADTSLLQRLLAPRFTRFEDALPELSGTFTRPAAR